MTAQITQTKAVRMRVKYDSFSLHEILKKAAYELLKEKQQIDRFLPPGEVDITFYSGEGESLPFDEIDHVVVCFEGEEV